MAMGLQVGEIEFRASHAGFLALFCKHVFVCLLCLVKWIRKFEVRAQRNKTAACTAWQLQHSFNCIRIVFVIAELRIHFMSECARQIIRWFSSARFWCICREKAGFCTFLFENQCHVCRLFFASAYLSLLSLLFTSVAMPAICNSTLLSAIER